MTQKYNAQSAITGQNAANYQNAIEIAVDHQFPEPEFLCYLKF